VPTKQCEWCEKEFVTKKTSPHAKTCSPECSYQRTKANEIARQKTPEGRAYNRAQCAKYRASAHGKAVRKKSNTVYAKSEKGKATNRKRARTYYRKKKAAGLCCEGGCWRKAWKGHVCCKKCHLGIGKPVVDPNEVVVKNGIFDS
jgi:hypothetical protein